MYGDFLSERADPRGEFIALQFKATLTPIEQKRMRALLRDHGSGWLLKRMVSRPIEYRQLRELPVALGSEPAIFKRLRHFPG